MSVAVRREPEVARLNVTTGRVPAGDLDPLRERLLRDVGRPGVKQAPEIVVPLSSGQFALELAPGWVGLEHVAYPDEVHRAIAERHVGIADADGAGLGMRGIPGPLELALGAPLAGTVAKGPFGVRVADVLEEEQFPACTVGDERPVGMLRERRLALPDRCQRSRGRGWFGDVELQHVWTCGAAVRFRSLAERRVHGEKESAVGEGNEG